MIISFEGGDGSGKGTQARLLKDFLENKGYKVIIGREPGSAEVSEEIRELLRKPRKDGVMVPTSELLLFEAARAEFVEKFLIPSMNEYDIVILDRFFDSTTAYQGYGRGLDLDMIHQLNYFATRGIEPDLTFVLDVKPETAMERCKGDKSRKEDRIENEDIEFRYRLLEGFRELAEKEHRRMVLVDAENNSIEAVAEIIQKKVLEKLK